eukprot:TRINITY_DN11259_c0_g1_i1.p1 TRINITY_DN11259_c0_g1~~TRINITY_DN11259_c0_g1_i1.p1  ORF type:complete len:611 (-),score=199.43 TRINITY_DN11259_c0_g1_i1:63-1895(-)
MDSKNGREENIQDRLGALNDLFNRIQNDLGLNSAISPQDQPMKIHPFNSVNIDEARMRFNDSLDRMNEVIRRHSSQLSIEKEQVTLNRYLKRLQDRNAYENQSKVMEEAFEQCQQIGNKYIQESISLMKESRRSDGMNPLKKSLSLGFSAVEQHRQKINQTIHRLKKMGQQLGLQFWTETASEGVPIENVENAYIQISLSSVALLIDVYLDSYGTILQVTLTLEDGTQRPEFNHELGQSLRRGIEDFAGKITKLTEQDKLYQELKEYNLKGIKTIMENDLMTIHQFERQSKSEIDLLLKHHGIMRNGCEGVVIHFYLPKLTLSLWESSKQDLQEFLYQNSLKEEGTLVYSLLLGVEKSKLNQNGMHTTPQCTVQNGQIVFSQENKVDDAMEIDGQGKAGVPARFVLFGDLVLCASSFQSLQAILNGSTRDCCQMNEYLESIPLERLLASNKESPQLENQLEVEGVKHSYLFSGTYNVNSGTIQIRRIPFSNANQLLLILQILRQQLVFTDLFSSCFSQFPNISLHSSKEESKNSLWRSQKQVLEVVTDAPRSINLTLMHPKLMSLFTVNIEVGLNGDIQTKSTVEVKDFDGVLKQTFSIPRAVNQLLESL